MSDINMQLVREFFELNRFHVLTHWQHDHVPRFSDISSILFVEHPSLEAVQETEFVLRPEEVGALARAIVEVRAWHADRFYPSVIESSPILGHVAGPEARALAESVFGGPDYDTVLVISELPGSPGPRARAVELLRAFGIGHVLEFPAIMTDILNRISAHGNYAPSHTLQTLRLLKRYDLVRRQQLEFGFSTEAPPGRDAPEVATNLHQEAQQLDSEE